MGSNDSETGRLSDHCQIGLGTVKGKMPGTRLAIFFIDKSDEKNLGLLWSVAGPGNLEQGLEHGCHAPFRIAGTAPMNAFLGKSGLELFIQCGKTHGIQVGCQNDASTDRCRWGEANDDIEPPGQNLGSLEIQAIGLRQFTEEIGDPAFARPCIARGKKSRVDAWTCDQFQQQLGS
jgi:hypothetical protein